MIVNIFTIGGVVALFAIGCMIIVKLFAIGQAIAWQLLQ